MKIIFRNFIVSAAVGFMIPTLAFATISPAPSAAAPTYLFALSYEDAEGAIGFALAEKGAGDKVKATINGRSTEALFSYNEPISVEIRGLQFDKAGSRWSANLLFVNEGSAISVMPVAGRFDEVVEIPMLKRQVRAGDVIKKEDVETRDYVMSRTRSDTITDLKSLIGKSPTRTISAGRPIYEQEIALPVVIEKDNVVQMYYRSPGVEISATGKAMEDGSTGKIINVRNLSSKKTVRAVVVNANTVNIITPYTNLTQRTSGADYASN
ncbi:MAG: flagellar basal body P-ring formation chaperone FlgA [Rickettsiales bacterium]